MKLGAATVITDESIRPDVLAKALENRGFDSLVVAEHSHIPACRATPFPAGGELPREYYRSYDPFVALTAAALATSQLLIGPGVLLLPQRDAIETAKAVSSLDQISAGRLLLGLGLGWNLEEAADHGVEATMRGKLLDEKLAAMKELWANEEAEFHGHHVDFDATYCWPKPVQKPHPKIYIGGFTAATVSRARRHHAGWMPMAVPVADMVPAQLGLLDGATDIPVSVIVPESVEPAVLTLTASMAQNERSSSFPPNPNRKRSNCSTALRHSPKHTAEPCTPAGAWADLAKYAEYVTVAMH